MTKIGFLLCFGIILVISKLGTGADDEYRLPDLIEPISYDLHITNFVLPPKDSLKFSGSVLIVAKVKKNLKEIKLHSKDLEINTVDVTKNDISISYKNFSFVEVEMINIPLKDEIISKDEVKINITYQGKMRNDMYGFYLSEYEEKNEKK